MRTLTGISLNAGYAEGPIFVFRPEMPVAPPRTAISASEVPAEVRTFRASLAQTRSDLELVQEKFAGNIDDVAIRNVFHAHIHLLTDPAWIDDIERRIRDEQITAAAAVHEVTEQWAQRFARMENPYLAERAIDLRDVSRRVLIALEPACVLPIANLARPSIVVARSVMPSDMVHLDRANTLAIVTEEGGVADHVAIVTRSMGIPGITGVKDVAEKVHTGERAIIDGKEGKLLVAVSKTASRRYHALARRREAERQALEALRDVLAQTKDGHRVRLCANIGDVNDAKLVPAMGAEEVGLFRTELAFLTAQRHPSEVQQLATYRAMAKAAGPVPLTIRTLDLGGDKMLAYDQEPLSESNPLLGRRGIRRSLAEPRTFRRQLRALLRLGAEHDVRVLLPMVVSVSDVVRAREQIAIAADELYRAGHEHRPNLPVGAMIETPSAVLIIDELLPHVDFLSVGTNDLIQYLLVADRTAAAVRDHYTLFHPAVLRALHLVAQAARTAQTPLTLCGELAGFGDMTPLLLGLGFTTLSMAPHEIPVVKRHLAQIRLADAEALAHQTLRLSLRRPVADEARGEVAPSRPAPPPSLGQSGAPAVQTHL